MTPSSRTSKPSARELAFQTLVAVAADGAYANLELGKQLRANSLSSRDAAQATELVYGTVRMLGLYDVIIEECTHRPAGDFDVAVLTVLRMGAHQSLHMKVPAHAVVSTSVQLTRRLIGHRPAGLVNAVLRRVADQDLASWLHAVAPKSMPPVERLSIRYSHPRWLVECFYERLHDWAEVEAFLASNNEPAPVTLAARPHSSSVEELIDAGAHRCRYSPIGATLGGGKPSAVPAVKEGRAGVQDEGSQLVTMAFLSVAIGQPDTSWLDLCAGPGGKAALAGSVAATRSAHLTAVEVQEHRSRLVAQAVDSNVEVVTSSGTDLRWATAGYDRVLVDAPCSGAGALRRRPDARWRRAPTDITTLVKAQEELLANALKAVRSGGVVAYVTCSPIAAETRQIVDSVRGEVQGAKLLDAREWLPKMPSLGPGPDVQLWTHRHGTDAMYLALLQR